MIPKIQLEDSFHLGVKALIRNPNKEILLLERNPKFNKTYWDLPGGRLQKGESLLDTLKREVKEEIGLEEMGQIQPFTMFLTDIRIPTNQQDVGLIFSIFLWDIHCTFSPQLSEEHISYKWCPPLECLEKLKRFPNDFIEKLSRL